MLLKMMAMLLGQRSSSSSCVILRDDVDQTGDRCGRLVYHTIVSSSVRHKKLVVVP